MSDAFHGMENVEQTVFLATCGWGEDRTLQQIRVLQTEQKEKESDTLMVFFCYLLAKCQIPCANYV